MIAIEDLQWADEATLSLLGYLVRGIREGRLLLVLTVRTEDLQTDERVLSAIGDLERTGLVERIELARFSRPEVAAQIAGILRDAPGPCARGLGAGPQRREPLLRRRGPGR